MEIRKFRLEEIKFIDMYHFDMYEGKFLDVNQSENASKEMYIFANVSNFDAEAYEESPVRIYAHSYADLYDASDYALSQLEADPLLCEFLKSELLKRIPTEK